MTKPNKKIQMTLNALSNTLVEADFPDLFDFNVIGEIINTDDMAGSISDSLGDRIVEFDVIELNDDETEIIVSVDLDLYEDELINPKDYKNIIYDIVNDKKNDNYEEVNFSFSSLINTQKKPEQYICDGDYLYILKGAK